jgi:O-antigen/teichoic acid export membrane protein
MLLKHSAQYLLARGVPGILNFLAIALYTRMLSPDDYGRYALVIAGVGLFYAIFFHWMILSVTRFFPAQLDDPKSLLSAALGAFASISLFTGAIGLLLAGIWADTAWHGLILLAVPLLWAQAWFELNLSLSAVKLLPLRYGLINGTKAGSALAVGAVLVLWGLGAYGPLLGLLLGMLLTPLLWSLSDWKGVTLSIFPPLLGEILRYGLPLTATLALAFVVNSSDRFLIAWFMGEGSAGLYSAAYDLGQQTMTLLMTVVNLAAYPLAVRALEEKGERETQEQLRQNATVLLAVAIPSAVGIAVLAQNVSAVLLGASFHKDASLLLPWVAMAILLSGVRAYHFDLAFQLGRHNVGQIWIAGAAALLNVALNLLWIPHYGIIGAAYATFAAYLLALVLSAIMGRHVFPIPIPYKEGFRITMASLLMGVPLWLIPVHQGLYALASQILVGGTAYMVLLVLLNVGECRTRLFRKLMA